MELMCIKFCLDYENTTKGQLSARFLMIPCDDTDHLSNFFESENPAVFVVPQSKIRRLTKHEDIISFQGKKNRDKELYRILTTTDLIPLLKGIYQYKGKIESSVRDFLRRWDREKPEKANKSNAFILGADESLIMKIFEEHRENHPLVPALMVDLEKIILDLDARKKAANRSVLSAPPNAEELKSILLGSSEAMDYVRERIIQSGRHDRNILLLGETGTGKSMAARLIHNYSTRRNNPFVTFACGSVTGSLFESELYGYVEDSHSRATSDRKGLWQQAGEGTLFFDEIGDLPLYQQAKVLVAIGRKVIRPVGSDEEVPVRARLIFATNRDLFAMVKKGTFREDLYWRIRELPIVMPPLRKQEDAIRHIAVKLWEKIARDPDDKPLSSDILDQLERVSWTGNVRALKAVLNGLYYWNIDKHCKDLNDLNIVLGQHQLKTDETCRTCTPILAGSIVDMNQVRCLRHLKNTEEWLLACRKIFEPCMADSAGFERLKTIDTIVFKHRLKEAGRLAAEPFLFGNKESFMEIHNLQGKLAYFYEMISGELWEQAHEYLVTELSEHIERAQNLISEAVREKQ